MPQIVRFACTECCFDLAFGWGSRTVAVDDVGKLYVCTHPDELACVERVTGLSYQDASSAGRTFEWLDCVCRVCGELFASNFDRYSRHCRGCGSAAVETVLEAVGHPCPKCGVGTVERHSPCVRPPIDLNCPSGPVPDIVKQLVRCEANRAWPPFLVRAAWPPDLLEVLQESGEVETNDSAIDGLTDFLLTWWEGGTDRVDRGQGRTAELEEALRFTWDRALPALIAGVPELASLVTLRTSRCEFSDTVGGSVRRRIQNHVRRHRVDFVET